jgi:hypothetical protein
MTPNKFRNFSLRQLLLTSLRPLITFLILFTHCIFHCAQLLHLSLCSLITFPITPTYYICHYAHLSHLWLTYIHFLHFCLFPYITLIRSTYCVSHDTHLLISYWISICFSVHCVMTFKIDAFPSDLKKFTAVKSNIKSFLSFYV